jgi:hypothetical protein
MSIEDVRAMPDDLYVHWVMYFAQIAQDRQTAGR